MSWFDKIGLFWPLLLVSQLSVIGVIVIIVYWCIEYKSGYFDWNNVYGLLDWHALMMTLGMGFFFGEGKFQLLKRTV